MTVLYAGVPIDHPDPPGELRAVLDRYWHEHRVHEAEHPAYLTHGIDHLPIPSPPRRECPRLGVLHWPVGASRWATYHALVHGDTIAAVRSAIGTTPAAAELVISDGTTRISPRMWMLPPRPVCQKGDRELYLLSLVDQRWFWWLSGDVKVPDNIESWADLLTTLFDDLGSTPTLPTIPAAYGTPDVNRWSVGYKPIPLLIDAACATVGLRVVRKLNGTVLVRTASEALSADSAQWAADRYEVLTGGRFTAADVARGLPAGVAVVFPAGTPDAAEKVDVTLSSLSLSEYDGIEAAPGWFGQVNADTPATAAEEDREDYAEQAASDYYLWALSPTDATLRGVVAWEPTGCEAAVEWVHEPGRVVTRVLRQPFADRSVRGSAPADGGVPVAMMTAGVDATGRHQVAKRVIYNDGTAGIDGDFYEAEPLTEYLVENYAAGGSDPSKGWLVGQVVYVYPSLDRADRWRAVPFKHHSVIDDGEATGTTGRGGVSVNEITAPGGSGEGYQVEPSVYSQDGGVTHRDQELNGRKAFALETVFVRGLVVNPLGVDVAEGGPFPDFNKFKVTTNGQIWTNQTDTGAISDAAPVRRLPVYNEVGTFLGYIPIHNGA